MRALRADLLMPKLLTPGEPEPVLVSRAAGASPFVITCDHAGRVVPRSLGTLGLPLHEFDRHIAFDIGAWGVSVLLAEMLDAPTIGQAYSRLVIDCNRAPGVPTSIVEVSELTPIPGNACLSAAHRDARAREIFWPYQNRIKAMLDAREDRPTVLVAMHSFTPTFKSVSRPWHAGVLFNRDGRLARIVLDMLRREPGLVVGENEPYAVTDLTDYTVPVHGEKRGLPHVELEIRQDLIADASGQRQWAEIFARLLPEAWHEFEDRR
jgi:predicted N-formylglutamate amidohydrolase